MRRPLGWLSVCLWACSPTLRAPDDAHIRCASQSQCPQNFDCNAEVGRCIARQGGDKTSPQLITSSLTPLAAQAGDVVTLHMSFDETLLADPVITSPGIVFARNDSASDYVYTYSVSGIEPEQVEVKVAISDLLGNAGVLSLGTLSFDSTPPTLGIPSLSEAAGRTLIGESSTLVVALEVEDDVATISGFLHTLDGVALADVTLPLTAPTGIRKRKALAAINLADVMLPASPAGDVNVAVTLSGSDAAGNPSNTVSSTALSIDRTAPVATITSAAPDARSRDTTFTFAADDATATLTCTFDGAPPSPCTSPVSFVRLRSGAHTFSVTATDPVGHVSPTVQVDWTIENYWTHLAAGGNTTCAIDLNGALYCWGADNLQAHRTSMTITDFYSFLGRGSGVYTDLDTGDPLLVPSPDGGEWKHVTVARTHVCAISEKDDKRALYCWGNNNHLQLGQAVEVFGSVSPLRVGANEDWLTVSAGGIYALTISDYSYTCGIRRVAGNHGRLYCWGGNWQKVLGLGPDSSTGDYGITEVAGGGSDWVDVAMGSASSACGIREQAGVRSLYCWGALPAPVAEPTDYSAGHEWQTFAAGGCGLTTTGDLYCLGNEFGTLYPSRGYNLTPVLRGSGYAAVDADIWGACAASATAPLQLHCIGENTHGQIVTAVRGSFTATTRPLTRPIAQVAAGIAHLCLLDDLGAIECVGDATRGQLGNGHVANDLGVTLASDGSRALEPVATPWLATDFATIAFGDDRSFDHTNHYGRAFGIKLEATERRLYFAGLDRFHVVDDIDNERDTLWEQWTRVGNAGDWLQIDHWGNFCGIRDDITTGDDQGSLWCAGPNSPSNAPPGLHQVASAVDWTSVSTGSFVVCGLRLIGGLHKLYCMGTVSDPPALPAGAAPGVPVEVTVANNYDWRSIAVAERHACGIHETALGERLLYCWGDGTSGQLGDNCAAPSTTTTRTAPTLIDIDANAGSVAASDWLDVYTVLGATCATRPGVAPGSKRLYCWGANRTATTASYACPIPLYTDLVPGDGDDTALAEDWVDVFPDRFAKSFCANKTDGSLHCWGPDTASRPFGHDQPDGPIDIAPRQVGTAADCATRSAACDASNDWTAVWTGNGVGCAKRGSDIVCFGWGQTVITGATDHVFTTPQLVSTPP